MSDWGVDMNRRMGINFPCHNCTERQEGCHRFCEQYKDACKKIKAAKLKQRAEDFAEYFCNRRRGNNTKWNV